MWILSSLSRPDRIREVVDSYVWGGESTVVLALYKGDARLREYQAQRWPSRWRIEVVDMLGNGPTYNEILRRYPGERTYGFLADDAVLDHQGMLATLEDQADAWHVAYANDRHHEDRICTMPCIGGELVRAVGYLAHQNLVHMSIDCMWHAIGRRLGLLRFQPHLTYTHKHPLFGRAEVDNTYLRAQLMSAGHEQVMRGFVNGGELERIAECVAALRAAA